MNTEVTWDVTLCRGAKTSRRLHSQGHADKKILLMSITVYCDKQSCAGDHRTHLSEI